MGRVLRTSSGVTLLGCAIGTLFYGVLQLRAREYLGCIILVLTGLSLLRAGVDLLAPPIEP